MMSHLIDAVKGNSNTKIIERLTLLRIQLNRIEAKLEEEE